MEGVEEEAVTILIECLALSWLARKIGALVIITASRVKVLARCHMAYLILSW